MGSLDDEEESDEARGPTESEAKRGSHREMRSRKRDKGEEGDRKTGREEKKEERAERVTAVGEVRAEPFTARTKKTNRRDERSQARCLGRPLGHYLGHGAISFIEQAFCDYHRAGVYFRVVLVILLHVERYVSLVAYNAERVNAVRG